MKKPFLFLKKKTLGKRKNMKESEFLVELFPKKLG